MCNEEYINPRNLRLSQQDSAGTTSSRKRKRDVTFNSRRKRQGTTNSSIPEPREGVHQARVVNYN